MRFSIISMSSLRTQPKANKKRTKKKRRKDERRRQHGRWSRWSSRSPDVRIPALVEGQAGRGVQNCEATTGHTKQKSPITSSSTSRIDSLAIVGSGYYYYYYYGRPLERRVSAARRRLGAPDADVSSLRRPGYRWRVLSIGPDEAAGSIYQPRVRLAIDPPLKGSSFPSA